MFSNVAKTLILYLAVQTVVQGNTGGASGYRVAPLTTVKASQVHHTGC